MATSGAAYPESVNRLIDELSRLPGIGLRSAERIAFFVLKAKPDDAMRLSRAIDDVKKNIRHCSVCFNLTDADPCPICASESRDASTMLVVEQPKDLISLEQTGLYKGVYHVLMGRIDPLAGVTPEDVTIADLLKRVDEPTRNSRETPVKEVILGLNPDLEGDSTALYLADQLTSRKTVKVTRLARGLPAGSQLEYVSGAVLADAIQGRQEMG